ncbi:MAG: hypothetical protein QNJ55_18590 [Xenococcus sp. MO_188.B8]|nr:hypothetical protein [Xenococcus sp. MO_188.B8]
MCDPEITFLRKKLDVKQQEIDVLKKQHQIEINGKNEEIRLQEQFIEELKISHSLLIDRINDNHESEINDLNKLIDIQSNKIRELTTELSNLIKRPIVIDQSRNVNIYGKTIKITGAGVLSLSDIEGQLANNINQSKLSFHPNETKINQSLTQLQDAINREPELNEKLKNKALEQIQILEKASQKPTDEDAIKAAEDAKTMLDGIVYKLPAARALVTICDEVFPLICSYFGF